MKYFLVRLLPGLFAAVAIVIVAGVPTFISEEEALDVTGGDIVCGHCLVMVDCPQGCWNLQIAGCYEDGGTGQECNGTGGLNGACGLSTGGACGELPSAVGDAC